MLTGFAAADAHFHSDDAFGGWVMVKAEHNEPEALLDALKQGRYYATQGPEIRDKRCEDDHLVVETSPVRSIALAGLGAKSAAEHGESLTVARLDLAPFRDSWCRLVIPPPTASAPRPGPSRQTCC